MMSTAIHPLLRRYVTPGLLPHVRANLPEGKHAAGVFTAGGLAIPLVVEHVTDNGFRSCRPFYVGYAEGKAVIYFSPARFRTLVRQHRALIVTSQMPIAEAEVAA